MCAQERVEHALGALGERFREFLDASPEWKKAFEEAKLVYENAADPVSKSRANEKLRHVMSDAERAFQSWLTQA
jgi:hypothetical protein